MKTEKEYIIGIIALQILHILDEADKPLPMSIIAARATVLYGISISTTLKRLEMFIKMGIVDEIRVYQKRKIKINEKGKMVLEHLEAVSQLLDEN